MTGTDAAAAGASQNEIADVLQERLIDSEYKIWKKNTPYLYDIVMTHSLEWPSLTCQWLPISKSVGTNASELSLLLGTHTNDGEPNYLMVASTIVATNDPVVPPSHSDNTSSAAAAAAPPQVQYDEDRQEVGGFGHATTATGSSSSSGSIIGKVDYKMKIQHEGEVNRARYMPQNHFMIATRGPSPEVFVFDRSKHPSKPEAGAVFSPQIVCCGHSKEGYGLAWSKLKEGYLLSGSEDTTVCLWDVNSNPAAGGSGNQVQPLSIFKGHTAVVEDIDWHAKDCNLIASVSDDRTIRLWDVRNGTTKGHEHIVENAHAGDINGVSFNPVMEMTFATASADKTVAIWDMRNLKQRVHTLEGHTDEVYMVDWAPFNESILGSCSADRRVAIWDLSRTGQEQSEEDAEDGPPELLFLHGGHTAKVSDFSWNEQHPWVVASVSEDNVLQVWQCAEEIYAGEDDDEDDGDEGADGLLGEDELE
ncbi:chromatin assembly factor subunit C [Nitzschia inconspicua]|uniref:Chromatin assembly factor subunit C n=1 Tax=Nitzschia inconspicua TaxID=303405 RepID=A0A9K3LEE9_9STRA|nr:chromatin assembly factor subunit C [Nitzschia inconspicua]